ncbi:MAG: SRPBCC family protein [Planctomycetota bacterium]|jgi:uncharacterized protein YndB with AHSA1/START domain
MNMLPRHGWNEPAHTIDDSLSISLTRALPTPVEQLWRLWTTNEGISTFFCQAPDIDLRPGGNYRIIFQPDAPQGERGAEDSTILSYIPHRSLTFTWSAPPSVPEIRALGSVCWVTLEFNAIDDNSSQLTLTHHGFGEGPEWAKVHEYFSEAWPYVLNMLEKSINDGPIDWEAHYAKR